eukprot:29692-Pelagococcus_subviridis.AAC.4
MPLFGGFPALPSGLGFFGGRPRRFGGPAGIFPAPLAPSSRRILRGLPAPGRFPPRLLFDAELPVARVSAVVAVAVVSAGPDVSFFVPSGGRGGDSCMAVSFPASSTEHSLFASAAPVPGISTPTSNPAA